MLAAAVTLTASQDTLTPQIPTACDALRHRRPLPYLDSGQQFTSAVLEVCHTPHRRFGMVHDAHT